MTPQTLETMPTSMLPIIFEFPIPLKSHIIQSTFPALWKTFNPTTSKAGVLETASKLRKMKSMPAREKSGRLSQPRAGPGYPRFRGTKKARVSGYKRIQVWGKFFLHKFKYWKTTEWVYGCKSGKNQLRLVVYPIGFRVLYFYTSQVVSRSSSINSTSTFYQIHSTAINKPHQTQPPKLWFRSVWSVGLRVTKSKKNTFPKEPPSKNSKFPSFLYTLED